MPAGPITPKLPPPPRVSVHLRLPAGSVDAAVVVSLAPGNYSVQVGDDAARGGSVLTEIYTAEPWQLRPWSISRRARPLRWVDR
jgi:hypothetical protein